MNAGRDVRKDRTRTAWQTEEGIPGACDDAEHLTFPIETDIGPCGRSPPFDVTLRMGTVLTCDVLVATIAVAVAVGSVVTVGVFVAVGSVDGVGR